ncbi:eukaryotic translation initiation factor 2D-like [Rhopilema esculentum]|uniref:eukaryotic translation initiation factor 2D-like n=1 Tax=Rhopilema esculentum TaxID=499914 RepID=UPI0031D4F48A
MFKKPIRIKTSNRMKGSERKRLKQRILQQFTQLTEDKLNEILPSKEDVFVTKIENGNGIFITSFFIDRNPMFFEIDKENQLFPSVYALWQHVDLIPYMVTAPPVFEKISRGADLMLPGVIKPYGGFDHIEKGQIVAIRIAGNSAPVACGKATMSSKEMQESGMRGKGVQIYHWYTDNLWSSGDSSDIPSLPDSPLDVSFAESLERELETLNLNHQLPPTSTAVSPEESDVAGEDCEVLHEEPPQTPGIDDNDEDLEISNGSEKVEDLEDDEPKLTPEEQTEQLLENCFYQAMIDAKKIELPILVTTFSAQFLHPACPEGQKIDMKKTRYKKMGKFLQEMESRGLVKVGELSKGVLSITAMTFENECLRNFKASSFAKDKSVAKAEALAKKEEESSKEGMAIIELFGVSGKTQSFFKEFGRSKGDALTAPEVRDLLKIYVKDNELVNQSSQRKVNLDPMLSDILLDKNFYEESVTWDVLMSRFLEKMNPCHKIIINGKPSKIKKGKAEPIEVKIEQRMGNKKVTLVKNLEQFGIDPNEFAHQLQVAAASSTTVNPLPGKTASSMQVLIQGMQTNHVAKVLDQLNVPKKYITGLDKAKGKNKKR